MERAKPRRQADALLIQEAFQQVGGGAERLPTDPMVLRWVKSLAAEREVPYQSLINDLLAGEMKKAS